ncbi:MAG: 2-C-methyl-D-erythritol 2,4-cyclodiphosphate synthase [Planctomycetes bacterium]|nr:2-C-methyl-D-erythritol 2,4-cyclodiphosphate synthase [Planctomycetota bacterium]
MTPLRIGTGFDLHRLAKGRKFVLGGIEIPFEKGPVGHSDGDPLLHAVADALLGAAGLEDLGTLFPDSDPKWKGADSARLLEEAAARVRATGWMVVSVDAVVMAERPKIAPHRAAIRDRLSRLLAVPLDCVNVKGKTAEALGPLGKGEAIAACAVALLASSAGA